MMIFQRTTRCPLGERVGRSRPGLCESKQAATGPDRFWSCKPFEINKFDVSVRPESPRWPVVSGWPKTNITRDADFPIRLGAQVIDLHLHTTASDGRCSPEELVQRAKAAGVNTMAVTDHDTMAAVPAARAAALTAGLEFVPGIEITSVSAGRDVHVLGYFVDPETAGLSDLIADQRRRRVARAQEIGERLARMGATIDVQELIATTARQSGKAIARPQIAQALITAGHVGSVAEAFDRYLGDTCGAYVPHTGAQPEEVIRLVRAGGGVASLAHPGYTKQDAIIPRLAEAGLTAIEAYHSSHDAEMTARYLAVATSLDLAVTGGSDYHGDGTRRSEWFGRTHLPAAAYLRFLERAGRTRAVATARV